MSKYEWTKRKIEEIGREYPPEKRQYIDAFLEEVRQAGEALTRAKFFELLAKCDPALHDDVDYFDYEVLNDSFKLSADFSEAWNIPDVQPLPRIQTAAKYGKVKLPEDFCVLGGVPDWIQREEFPPCEQCDGDMVLFLQLKSLPYSLTKKQEELEAFTFGDAGNFYLFQCPQCDTYKTAWQCH